MSHESLVLEPAALVDDSPPHGKAAPFAAPLPDAPVSPAAHDLAPADGRLYVGALCGFLAGYGNARSRENRAGR